MKSAQCMNICHFFKVDELLKLRTDSEYSLLNTKKVSRCIYFCAMINFLMNHRRKYLFSPSSKHLSLFLFKYYSIIFLIKKRGISGHLVQMRTKNVRISLNRLVYPITPFGDWPKLLSKDKKAVNMMFTYLYFVCTEIATQVFIT